MMTNFEHFLEAHPKYNSIYSELLHSKSPDRTGWVLAASARLVHEIQGEALGPVADEILTFVDHCYPPVYTHRYISRVAQLIALQRRFDQSPSAKSLGDPGAHVDTDDYSLSLLLSIVLTNHRFEIMSQLLLFLQSLLSQGGRGRIVSVGCGTGYELLLASRILPKWEIEAYEINEEMRDRAKRLWSFFQVSAVKDICAMFPLDNLDSEFIGRYDAVILCEVCEHLQDPLCALTRVREYLKENGKAFVTMAINIAQEDHVFLYPTVQDCRSQIHDAGLHVVSEWLAPQVLLTIPQNRENGFRKGNYIAVVRK